MQYINLNNIVQLGSCNQIIFEQTEDMLTSLVGADKEHLVI